MIEPNWMPVFVAVEATHQLHAFHPDERGHPQPSVRRGADYFQRVGTAIQRSDGGYNVQLFAVPLNAKLVIRPPQPGERLDPTVSAE